MAELTDVTGVSETRAENLRDEGFTTVDDVAEADASDLEDVHGVGESTAYDLIDSAQEVITGEHSSDDEDEPEEEEDEEEVGLEDLEEVNEGDPEGYNERTESEPPEEEEEDEDDVTEVDLSDDEDEPEEEEAEEEEDGDDEYTVEVSVPSDEHYDYLLAALVESRLERSSTNLEAQQAINGFIEAVRPLGGEGTAEVELTAFGLNTVHASVQQAESRHQQNRQNDAFEAMRDMKEQVNEARSEYLF
jgi:transcription termination factor NusA